MRPSKKFLIVILFLSFSFSVFAKEVHPWEKQELTFTAINNYNNPYKEVTIWVDLVGPDFNKRIYGFWDGGQTYHIRLVAIKPGKWSWESGSTPEDPGLSGKTGKFDAIEWTEAEKDENPLRHGFIRSTPNHHALEYADGTPYLIIGDTWYSLGTNRFRWYNDNKERAIGPDAGFKDYVRYRKAQGYNWVNMIAAFPNWMTDGRSWHLVMNDSAKTTVRSAWLEFGIGSAKNMDNEGGRPFFFPGKVPGYEQVFPNVDSINPAYFKYIDRKIDYLNANGFVPFIEVSRRDAGLCWYKYYGWPDSYARFIEYVWSRYQANNVVLSPIHLDIIDETVSPEDYINAIHEVEKKYGPPPFGTLLSANANPSTLENWRDHSWVTLHQIGNMREHNNYWYLTEIFNLKDSKPALNGEPYYAGYRDARSPGSANYTRGAKGGTELDNEFVRSGIYGSFLSGGFAGFVYGAEGIWGADIEPSAPVHMWEAFEWKPADLVSPNKSQDILSYQGWAYCARTNDKNIFLAYFEKGCKKSQIRGARMNSLYEAQWFNPGSGTWQDVGDGTVVANKIGIIQLPDFPDDKDWGLCLIYLRRLPGMQ